MPLAQYFRDELAYLRVQGKAFAQAHPELARFLAEQTTDPDVERLLEGFAFLTGSLRARIEDEFPELTHGLLGLLWPNYLRPVPSLTMMQFTVLPGAIAHPTRLEAGCQLDSRPQEGVICHFRTCRPCWIYPADIREINAQSGADLSTISLSVALHTPSAANTLQLDKLSWHLGGDRYTAHELYHWLCRRVTHLELEVAGQRYPLAASSVRPIGFSRDEALLPYPDNVYSGYRVLQEFFSFPEGLLFFGLSEQALSLPAQLVTGFTLHFCFDRPLPATFRIRPDTFMLNCVPAINLFQHDSEPITLNGQRHEYPLKASYREGDNFEIFSVDSVEGWLEGGSGRIRGGRRVYHPFESFRHQRDQAAGRDAFYYRMRVRETVASRGFEHALSFMRGDESQIVGLNEAVSVRLTCTNRNKAATLQAGDICVPTGMSPSFATFRNLQRPTRPLRPVLDGSLHWMLISNLSLNYLSLLQRDALVQILRTYDFPALHDKQAAQVSHKRLAGIVSIDSAPLDRLVQGMPVRGLRSELSLSQQAFGSEGELYLFSTVLAHFLGLYASVNSFHQLEVINLDNRERYRWPVQIGQHSLM